MSYLSDDIAGLTEQPDEPLEGFSFAPVAKVDEDDTAVIDEEVTDGALEEEPVKLSREPSERMERLRSYYAQLGQARETMAQEVAAALAGEETDEDIENKLYEYSHAWRRIAGELNKYDAENGHRRGGGDGESYVGMNLVGQDYSGQSLENGDFSAANLQDANFKDAKLAGADFSNADLSGADLSGADLSDCIFAGAKLKGTNFTGANMRGVILRDADIEDAVLMDINLDELALEELQALVEYLAIYYPHKLNLQRINLSLLDLSRIDLRQVNLKGVDFTGLDFTGVNIMELDLSECIITPEQIAQALGRKPTAEELKKLFEPKNKKKAKPFYIDFTDLLSNGHFTGWIDLTKGSISTDQLVKAFLKAKGALSHKTTERDDVIFEKAKAFHAERMEAERKAYNDEQKRNIEERKQKMRVNKPVTRSEKYVPIKVNLGRSDRE